MNADVMSPTIEPHEPHWMSKAAFPVVMAAFYITQIALGVAVYHSLHWLTIPLVLLSSHLMHGALIALHEASHGLLRKKRLLNEIDGTLIAAFSLHQLQPLPRRSSIASCAPGHRTRRGTLAIRQTGRLASGKNLSRRSRTRPRLPLHAISFLARLSQARIDHSPEGPPP